MKKATIIFLAAVFAADVCCYPQNVAGAEELQENGIISHEIHLLKVQLDKLEKDGKAQSARIDRLQREEGSLAASLDTLGGSVKELASAQRRDSASLGDGIRATHDSLAASSEEMDARTVWGGALLLLTAAGFGAYLRLRRRKDTTSMGEVRKAQDALRAAQSKLQEDSVRLDGRLLELMERQMNAAPAAGPAPAETDHSLALKVADEIVRIELNLSRMDASVKGYKQLKKAVERIKDNFKANNYEIIDMLGKPYNEGMKVVANFVPDETLKEGEQIITGITKPQINYNGRMIQSAQITVSQNIQ